MTSGGRFTRVDMTDNDDVDMSLHLSWAMFFRHGEVELSQVLKFKFKNIVHTNAHIISCQTIKNTSFSIMAQTYFFKKNYRKKNTKQNMSLG